ncbi:MAG: restriction endonuclease, partial [Flavobacteriaceae bacterium]
LGNGDHAGLYEKGTDGELVVCNMPPISLTKEEVYASCMVDFKMMMALSEGTVKLDAYDWILGTRPRIWMYEQTNFYLKYAKCVKEFYTHVPEYAGNATNFNCGHAAVHYAANKQKAEKGEPQLEDKTEEVDEFGWQDKLIETMKGIDPDQFERLCQRLLRELGFVNVEVTGRTNDGGIDGKGIIKLGSVLSYHVVFQAKRYLGSVSSSVMRDFRVAMSGRADKGLILTTESFTREAKKEATRDGATPIDLIDGNDFAEHLKELNLGVKVEMVEEVKIKSDWFKNI